jgi:hypothetical protein
MKTRTIIANQLVILFGLLSLVACSQSTFPMEIMTSISPDPVVGQDVTLHTEISVGGVHAPNTTVEISLSPGVELVEGDLIWKGDIEPDQTISFDVTIRVTTAGDWPVSIYAYSSPDGESRWGDQEFFYIRSSDTSAQIIPQSEYPTQPIPVFQTVIGPTSTPKSTSP